MHTEEYTVSEPLAAQVARARARRKPVVAVGTTVVRALESAANGDGQLQTGRRSTRLLITPGYELRGVNALLTTFHAPRSTLLALLFAFAGTKAVQAAYAEAVLKGYRFLSYGDAMWVPPLLSDVRAALNPAKHPFHAHADVALFLARPCPFYLLDEVEAALDDVNLHRFLTLVAEFRREAQLLIVSHQKRTMEAADCLFGVTMKPGGSSKVVTERASTAIGRQ